jgi:hypothetical protein
MRKQLEQAADLRARGVTWEAIAQVLNCKLETCRDWPNRYADEWRRLLGQSDRQHQRDAQAEGRRVLRELVRAEDAKTKLRAACRLYAPTTAKSRRTKPPAMTAADRDMAMFISELKGLSDEDLQQLIDDAMAARGHVPGIEDSPGAPLSE